MIRVKVLCNWCTSRELIDSKWFQKMKPPSTNIEFVSYDNVDFYVILNKPLSSQDYYKAERTIVIQLEPWCDKPFQNWGVKTWGIWAQPDPRKFMHVRDHNTYVNGLHWELTGTYNDLLNIPILKSGLISTVTTSKYFDPGHIFRIDFIKFLEKFHPDISIDVYGFDNCHNFKGYKGSHPIGNKDVGMLPYKYYFHAENNDEYNFITEKIWDSVMAECVCFYWGCPNIDDYVDSACYILLSPNPNDFETNYTIVKKALENDEWSKRVNRIRDEKRRIIGNFNLYPTIENVIKSVRNEPVYVIIHCCTIGSGIKILEGQIKRIKNNQLYNRCRKIIVFTMGPKPVPLDNKIRLSKKIEIRHLSDDSTLAEAFSIKNIPSLNLDMNSKILYIHTKGVKYTVGLDDLSEMCGSKIHNIEYKDGKLNIDSDPIKGYKGCFNPQVFMDLCSVYTRKSENLIYLERCTQWKNYMEYALIEYFEKCIEYLDNYDVVGVNLQEAVGTTPKHFSGNFWWMRMDYLMRHINKVGNHTHSVEFWAASNEGARLKNICSSKINHYNISFPESIYKSMVDNAFKSD